MTTFIPVRKREAWSSCDRQLTLQITVSPHYSIASQVLGYGHITSFLCTSLGFLSCTMGESWPQAHKALWALHCWCGLQLSSTSTDTNFLPSLLQPAKSKVRQTVHQQKGQQFWETLTGPDGAQTQLCEDISRKARRVSGELLRQTASVQILTSFLWVWSWSCPWTLWASVSSFTQHEWCYY